MKVVFPEERDVDMQKSDEGYYVTDLEDLPGGTRYFLQVENEVPRPDPGSHAQPLGVHGPSEVVNHDEFVWHDGQWQGRDFQELIFYELHVGTFTREGTFEAIIPRLDELVKTGINALELMPLAQFPGGRNWGYDGVFPFAVQNSYGGFNGLKRLVDECHQRQISVFVDVVYNHLGPEGNYFSHFAPFFTDRYKVPWGDAVNFDGEWSDGVRHFIVDNIRNWFINYHVDGLRLDAIHTMFDTSAVHILQACNDAVAELRKDLNRSLYLVAESDFNDPRVVTPVKQNGLGFDAQWLDDFHHALYVLLDENGKERYEDFGKFEQLVKAFRDGFVLDGGYVSFRKRHYGKSSAEVPAHHFVAFNQNHDQIGNRPMGERLSVLVNFNRLKIATAAVMLSPYVPMLFMGEEYGEDAPFFYFVSHSDQALIQAVREGRKEEFAAFGGSANPPDADDENTYLKSKIDFDKRTKGKYTSILRWTTDLIRLRRSTEGLNRCDRSRLEVGSLENKCLVLIWRDDVRRSSLLCFLNLSTSSVSYVLRNSMGKPVKVLDSRDYVEDAGEAQATEGVISSRIVIAPESVLIYRSEDNGFERGKQSRPLLL